MIRNDPPETVFLVDRNGTPERVIDRIEITDAGFTLACRLGAARGRQLAISDAINEVIDTWGDAARYVFVSALAQLSGELVPVVASLAKTATGVDWAAHCEAMLSGNYDPRAVNKERRHP